MTFMPVYFAATIAIEARVEGIKGAIGSVSPLKDARMYYKINICILGSRWFG